MDLFHWQLHSSRTHLRDMKASRRKQCIVGWTGGGSVFGICILQALGISYSKRLYKVIAANRHLNILLLAPFWFGFTLVCVRHCMWFTQKARHTPLSVRCNLSLTILYGSNRIASHLHQNGGKPFIFLFFFTHTHAMQFLAVTLHFASCFRVLLI